MPGWTRPLALLLALAPITLVAQDRQAQPTFRSGVQSIEVDVLVTGKGGRAVSDLTRDDFILLEDGVPQEIATFSFVDLPMDPPKARKAAIANADADVVTNTGDGRMYVMALNGGGPRAAMVARRFVEEAVGPFDQVAVVNMLGTAGASQGFTRNRHLLLTAINRITGESSDPLDGNRAAGDGPRAREASSNPPLAGADAITASFAVIEELSRRLGLVAGRRKVVLWFDPPSVFIPDFDDRSGASHMLAQRDAVRAAARNNVALYPVSTMGLTTAMGMGSLMYGAGLRVLSDDTGGDAIVGTNNFSGAFQRVVRDNSAYYMLGYAPPVDHRDGRFHKLTVRVRRPGVHVRARRGYYAATAVAAAATPAVEGLSGETIAALGMPLASGQLPIELVAMPFRDTAGRASVLLAAELRGADLALGAGERIEFAHQTPARDGGPAHGGFRTFDLDLAPASRSAVERGGLRFVDRVALPRGRHQVRFVVHQPNGRTGSVLADVEVPDYSRPLVMSGVAIGSRGAAPMRTLQSDPTLRSILGSDPTTTRTFGGDDELSAYVEVYTNPGRGADAVVLTASVKDAVGFTRVERASVVFEEAGKAGYVTRIDLSSLAPGEYVLTFDATAGRARAARQVPFRVN